MNAEYYYYCIVTNTDDTVTGNKTATTVSKAVSVQVFVLAGNYQVGSEVYGMLEESVAAVPDGGTITMLQDVSENKMVLINTTKAFNIDLGGHNLTYSNAGYLPYLITINSGTVTIRNGSIRHTIGGSPIIIHKGGTLHILDGEYLGNSFAVCANGNGALAVITSGHFVRTSNSFLDSCLDEQFGGIINLAPGSVASVIPWANNRNTKEVTITAGISNEDVKFGDVDGDGAITAYDATLVLQHVVGMITLEGNALKAADTDHDGNITTFDATLILQYVVGMIKSLD
jgi:hypothetical protein